MVVTTIMIAAKPSLTQYYVDGHIHIGRANGGEPIKISAAPSLTLTQVIHIAMEEKGIQMIGLIDAVATPVLRDIEEMLASNHLRPLQAGGLQAQNGLTILLGGEIEVRGPTGGAAHFGVFVPHIEELRELAQWLSKEQTNSSLSSQRVKFANANALGSFIYDLKGILMVNHAFTPHKGLYGNCVAHLADMIDPKYVTAIELGLSSDTEMADYLSELSEFTFVTNSDAHSLPRIAREYHVAALGAPTFVDYQAALLRQGEGSIVKNIGLFPDLGKYHLTACAICHAPITNEGEPCTSCGATRTIPGVANRLHEIADRSHSVSPAHRPPYIHQVPLAFIPGIGSKLINKLLDHFGTEMNILNEVPKNDLAKVIGDRLADLVIKARFGELSFEAGHGGRYGKILIEQNS